MVPTRIFVIFYYLIQYLRVNIRFANASDSSSSKAELGVVYICVVIVYNDTYKKNIKFTNTVYENSELINYQLTLFNL